MSAVTLPVANPGPRNLVRDAKILVDAGARIIPIGWDKRPFFKWGRYRTTEPTADDITAWCNDPRTAGWAVLTGPVSGGWMGIDVEEPGRHYPLITDPLMGLPSTCKRKSVSGGGHAHVRVYGAPDDYDWSGQVIARVKSRTTGAAVLLAEVRGDGQYIILTGPGRGVLPEDFTPHEVSPEFFDALIAPGRALHDPSTSQRKALSRATGVVAAGVKRAPGGTGQVVRDAVMAQPDLWPLLLDPGWTVLGVYPRYEQVDGQWWDRVTLQRPGKQPGDGESGNALGPVLQVFSTTVSWWPGGSEGLSPMQAVAEAHFGGDYHKACTEAETAARMLVLDGVAPDPAGPFAAWPLGLLEDVHSARGKHDSEYVHVTATAGMSQPMVQGPAPEDAEPTAQVLEMHRGGGQTSADHIEAKARDKLRDLLISARASELLAEHRAVEAETRIRDAEARGENPLGWVSFDQNFWSGTASWVFLIPDVWPVGAAGAVYSGPGAGKSLLGLEWSACLATGQDILGKPVSRQRVLYLDYENDDMLVRQRLEAMGFGPGSDLSWLTYSMLGEWPPLDTPAGGARLLAEVQRLDVALVVIDTTARVIEGAENDADTFHALFRHTVLPLKRAGVALLRFDHTGKDAEKGERGSSAKRGDVDLSYELTADPTGRWVNLKRVKNRPHLPDPDVLVLERVTSPRLRHLPVAPTGGGMPSVGGPITSPNPAVDAIVGYVEANPGSTANDIEKGLAAAGLKFGKRRFAQARQTAQVLGLVDVKPGPRNSQLHFPGISEGDITAFVKKVSGHSVASEGDASEGVE